MRGPRRGPPRDPNGRSMPPANWGPVDEIAAFEAARQVARAYINEATKGSAERRAAFERYFLQCLRRHDEGLEI